MDLIFKEYKRKGNATVVPFLEYIKVEGDLKGVSVSQPDNDLANRDTATFEQGYIARNPENHEDKWYISKEDFDKNFEDEKDVVAKVNSTEKTLNTINSEDEKEKVSDVEIFGNPDLFVLISKASSKEQGWMKSTKAMEISGHTKTGVVIQVTTQQRNDDGSYAIADAITFVPDATIVRNNNGDRRINFN